MWKLTLWLLIGIFVVAPTSAQDGQIAASREDAALAAATDGLCHAKVAMIGEIATHGDGHTLAVKVALVERLIDRCGFDSIFFEANQDEFIHFNQRLRSGQAVTANDLLTAVGGIWKFYREFQPLAPFLLARAQTGRLLIGGLDDQLAQLGQTYANETMIAEFTRSLSATERQRCDAAFHQRIYFDYPPDAPDPKQNQLQLEACLAEVRAGAGKDANQSARDEDERQQRIAATERWVRRGYPVTDAGMADRDRSMYQTFQWWQSRNPERHKAIVWAATVHIAKQASPLWGDRKGTNLGSFFHRRYGRHALSLGFSAVAGSFREGKGRFPSIPVPPADSVEELALRGADADAVYVGVKQLKAMGTRPGAFFLHSYQTLPWSDFPGRGCGVSDRVPACRHSIESRMRVPDLWVARFCEGGIAC